MKATLTLSFLLLGTTQALAGDDKCTISLTSLGRELWSVDVNKDGIRGDRTILTLEDDVLFGFISGHRTRLRFADNKISGRFAAGSVLLTTETSGEHTSVRGDIGGSRIAAEASAKKLVLMAGRSQVDLLQVEAAPGRTVFAPEVGGIQVVFSGCEPLQTLQTRPGLLLVLDLVLHTTRLPSPY